MPKINIDKVSGFRPVKPVQADNVKQAKKETASPVDGKKAVNEDRIDVSDRASEVSRLVERLNEMPDVRQEKVSRLRGEIAAGRYNPSSEQIADAILKDERQ